MSSNTCSSLQIFSKEHINLLLSVYFFVLGIFALTHMIAPAFSRAVPEGIIPKVPFHLIFSQVRIEKVQ